MANTPTSTVPTEDTLGTTNNDIIALFQQFLQNYAQLNGGKRQLPPIYPLETQEDFPMWRSRLLSVLERHGLDEYILTDVPRPESPIERRQWLEDRADVDDYLRAAVIDPNVWNSLEELGWKATNINPKSTFDMLTHYFEDNTLDGQFTLLQELTTIRRGTFASMDAFRRRVNYLKIRLQSEESVFKMPDGGFMLLTLRGIAHEYPDLYYQCINAYENKTLTWSTLMLEFHRIATAESKKPALTTIRIDRENGSTINTNHTTATDTSSRKPRS
ncbi:hypothetical protein C7999DRAFT_28021 [Corynascus novoguineensis]|uniref:Uncharacterized protein n=1 Tax=Corynascus novoguineensis TaxID=1126955 RepID=A0AAN7D0L4_9PEZI|nr:hypothetical protein C7999DRAFT_28021 [Corynascus novoguineensis]